MQPIRNGTALFNNDSTLSTKKRCAIGHPIFDVILPN